MGLLPLRGGRATPGGRKTQWYASLVGAGGIKSSAARPPSCLCYAEPKFGLKASFVQLRFCLPGLRHGSPPGTGDMSHRLTILVVRHSVLSLASERRCEDQSASDAPIPAFCRSRAHRASTVRGLSVGPIHSGLECPNSVHLTGWHSARRSPQKEENPAICRAFFTMGDTGLELASGAQVRPGSPVLLGLRCSEISSGLLKLLPKLLPRLGASRGGRIRA
jgi:hypothetical protein